jgi:hypothetical protein
VRQVLHRIAARKAAAPGQHQLALRLRRLETPVDGKLAGAKMGERRQLWDERNADPRHDHLAQCLHSGRLHVVAPVAETGGFANRQGLVAQAMALFQQNDRLGGQRARRDPTVGGKPMIARQRHEDRLAEQSLPAQIVIERQRQDRRIE